MEERPLNTMGLFRLAINLPISVYREEYPWVAKTRNDDRLIIFLRRPAFLEGHVPTPSCHHLYNQLLPAQAQKILRLSRAYLRLYLVFPGNVSLSSLPQPY